MARAQAAETESTAPEAMIPAVASEPPRAALAAALIAAALLSQEVLVGRLLSVATWYSLGYLALTLGLLGMTAGALVVYLRPAWFEQGRGLSAALALSALGTVASTFWTTRTRVVLDLHAPWSTLGTLVVLSVLFALPFAGGGAALSVLLTRARRPGIVYGADLLGSAVGAALAAPLIAWLGAPRALLVAAVLPPLAMAVLARGGRERGRAGLLALAVLLIAQAPDSGSLRWIKGHRYPQGEQPLAQAWNSMSYVRAEHFRQQRPFYWAPLEGAPMPQVEVSFLRIDGEAGTAAYAYRDLRAELGFLDWDITSAVYRIREGGRALVIGVGGGRDVAAARLHGAEVDAVEFNPIFLRLLRGPMAEKVPIVSEPHTRFHVEDGRSWAARSEGGFRVIVASLVDTWASTGMGAMTLSENSLYTKEAWALFLSRLDPTGVLSFSRWYEPSRPLETGRLLALAASALRARGVQQPGLHLALVARGNIATLLTSPSPFDPADLEKLAALEKQGASLLWLPGRSETSWARELLEASAGEELARLGARQGVDLSPPTDDRPFFFLQVPLRTWFSPARLGALLEQGGGMLYGNVVAVGAVAAAFLIAALLGVLWLIVPLWRRRGALSSLPRSQRIIVLGYFAGLGLGFMLFEIATAQRLHLLLGDPTWALALTLTPLTLAAGAGAALSERLEPRRRVLAGIPAVAALLMGAWALLPSGVIESVLAQPYLWRATFSVLAVAIPGFAMGFLFPLGLRRVQVAAPEGAVWCWGVNGALSVAGSGAAVFLSVGWGISVTLLLAAGVYLGIAALGAGLARVGPGTDQRLTGSS
ncbi:MAG: class I SAM-dependent methyltransferase [Myxococcota bacterium]|nr:class I SAM-dependent methyltransferase [Myxococcota bacterium]